MMYDTEPESCDPGRDRRGADRPELLMCAECRADAVFPISIAGLGIFCSAGCVDLAQERRDAAITPFVARRGAA